MPPRSARPSAVASPPAFIPPQLSTAVEAPPEGARWLHEIKHDGYRLQVRVDLGEVRLFTRSGLEWTDRFASIGREAASLPASSTILDGEVCLVGPDGRASFGGLQDALSRGWDQLLTYYAFDLLWLDGEDLRQLPLERRKALLQGLLSRRRLKDPHIQFCDHLSGAGAALLSECGRLGLEGVVSKLRDAPYTSGRSRNWCKVKCLRRGTYVICGYTRSTAVRQPFKGLLLGEHRDGKLIFVGSVGTGFSHAGGDGLRTVLDKIRVDEPTLSGVPPAERRRAVWVKPSLTCEVAFSEITAAGELRHPSFKGLRN